MPVYKLSSALLQDAAATLDFRGTGTIHSMLATTSWDADADAEEVQLEVSFSSTNSLSSNDTTAAILQMNDRHAVGAAGAVNTGKTISVGPVEIPYEAGERLYLHISATSGTAPKVTVFLYCSESGAARPSTRRR